MKKRLAIAGIVVCCLTIIGAGAFLYHKYKPGYVYENGTWNYVSYDESIGRKVSPTDVRKDEFKTLKYKGFARDNTHVYFRGGIVDGSDPETFEIISTKGRYRYAKDKNNVYIYLRDDWSLNKIIHADPSSFEVLKFPYSKDKYDAYCGSLPLYVDDVSKFKVLEGTGFSITSSVDSFLGEENDLRDESSEHERNKHEYNRKKYGFITDVVIYSEDGEARTDKFTYKGYKLVSDTK